jgi:N-acetylneuraminic acid mutarotase
MIHSRYALAAVFVGGKIYAIGGAGESNITDLTMERYDPATNAWEALSSMPTERYHFGAAAAVLDGRIFVVGGWSGAMALDFVHLGTVEEYRP